MFRCMITSRGMTGAQITQKTLENSGVYSRIVRPPPGLLPEGCGYAVEIQSNDVAIARMILRSSGGGRIFCDAGDGYREMRV